MNIINKKFVGALSILILSACTTSPVQQSVDWQADDNNSQLNHFAAEGRLSVKVEDKGSYANFEWQAANDRQMLSVNTPLGNTLGQICQDSKGAISKNSKGKVFESASIDEMTKKMTGMDLPLSSLHLWATGRYTQSKAHQFTDDGFLQQDGWKIKRTIKEDGQIPRVLMLQRDNINIRLVFDNFNFEAESSLNLECPQRS